MKKRNFSAKQLKAQRAFARMAKARAKAARAAKRAAGKALRGRKRNPRFTAAQDRRAKKIAVGYVKRGASKKRARSIGYATVVKSVTKNGRKLYGAAAEAVLAKRAARNPKRRLLGTKSARASYKTLRKVHGKRVSKAIMRAGYGTHKKKNGVFRSAARSAISRRLSAPIRFRRRNSGTPGDIQAVHQMFLGRESDHAFNVAAPEGTPKDVAVLGELVCLKTKEENFEFDKGEAYLATDGQAKKLYILGDGYQGEVEAGSSFGPIEEIRYEAKKDHINPFRWRRRRRNSSLTEYYHHFGEEDGRMPSLKSDRDGLLHITGGNYQIKAEGIIN